MMLRMIKIFCPAAALIMSFAAMPLSAQGSSISAADEKSCSLSAHLSDQGKCPLPSSSRAPQLASAPALASAPLALLVGAGSSKVPRFLPRFLAWALHKYPQLAALAAGGAFLLNKFWSGLQQNNERVFGSADAQLLLAPTAQQSLPELQNVLLSRSSSGSSKKALHSGDLAAKKQKSKPPSSDPEVFFPLARVRENREFTLQHYVQKLAQDYPRLKRSNLLSLAQLHSELDYTKLLKSLAQIKNQKGSSALNLSSWDLATYHDFIRSQIQNTQELHLLWSWLFRWTEESHEDLTDFYREDASALERKAQHIVQKLKYYRKENGMTYDGAQVSYRTSLKELTSLALGMPKEELRQRLNRIFSDAQESTLTSADIHSLTTSHLGRFLAFLKDDATEHFFLAEMMGLQEISLQQLHNLYPEAELLQKKAEIQLTNKLDRFLRRELYSWARSERFQSLYNPLFLSYKKLSSAQLSDVLEKRVLAQTPGAETLTVKFKGRQLQDHMDDFLFQNSWNQPELLQLVFLSLVLVLDEGIDVRQVHKALSFQRIGNITLMDLLDMKKKLTHAAYLSLKTSGGLEEADRSSYGSAVSQGSSRDSQARAGGRKPSHAMNLKELSEKITQAESIHRRAFEEAERKKPSQQKSSAAPQALLTPQKRLRTLLAQWGKQASKVSYAEIIEKLSEANIIPPHHLPLEIDHVTLSKFNESIKSLLARHIYYDVFLGIGSMSLEKYAELHQLKRFDKRYIITREDLIDKFRSAVLNQAIPPYISAGVMKYAALTEKYEHLKPSGILGHLEKSQHLAQNLPHWPPDHIKQLSPYRLESRILTPMSLGTREHHLRKHIYYSLFLGLDQGDLEWIKAIHHQVHDYKIDAVVKNMHEEVGKWVVEKKANSFTAPISYRDAIEKMKEQGIIPGDYQVREEDHHRITGFYQSLVGDFKRRIYSALFLASEGSAGAAEETRRLILEMGEEKFTVTREDMKDKLLLDLGIKQKAQPYYAPQIMKYLYLSEAYNYLDHSARLKKLQNSRYLKLHIPHWPPADLHKFPEASWHKLEAALGNKEYLSTLRKHIFYSLFLGLDQADLEWIDAINPNPLKVVNKATRDMMQKFSAFISQALLPISSTAQAPSKQKNKHSQEREQADVLNPHHSTSSDTKSSDAPPSHKSAKEIGKIRVIKPGTWIDAPPPRESAKEIVRSSARDKASHKSSEVKENLQRLRDRHLEFLRSRDEWADPLAQFMPYSALGNLQLKSLLDDIQQHFQKKRHPGVLPHGELEHGELEQYIFLLHFASRYPAIPQKDLAQQLKIAQYELRQLQSEVRDYLKNYPQQKNKARNQRHIPSPLNTLKNEFLALSQEDFHLAYKHFLSDAASPPVVDVTRADLLHYIERNYAIELLHLFFALFLEKSPEAIENIAQRYNKDASWLSRNTFQLRVNIADLSAQDLIAQDNRSDFFSTSSKAWEWLSNQGMTELLKRFHIAPQEGGEFLKIAQQLLDSYKSQRDELGQALLYKLLLGVPQSLEKLQLLFSVDTNLLRHKSLQVKEHFSSSIAHLHRYFGSLQDLQSHQEEVMQKLSMAEFSLLSRHNDYFKLLPYTQQSLEARMQSFINHHEALKSDPLAPTLLQVVLGIPQIHNQHLAHLLDISEQNLSDRLQDLQHLWLEREIIASAYPQSYSSLLKAFENLSASQISALKERYQPQESNLSDLQFFKVMRDFLYQDLTEDQSRYIFLALVLHIAGWPQAAALHIAASEQNLGGVGSSDNIEENIEGILQQKKAIESGFDDRILESLLK